MNAERRHWVPWCVAALFIAALITIVGIVISALGAPEPGVFDDWARLDDVAGRVASWEYVLVGFVGVAVLIGSERTKSRALLRVALGYLAVLAVAALLGVLALFERQTLQLDGTRPLVDYYTPAERFGEIIVFAGLLVAIAAIGAAAMASLRSSATTPHQATTAA